MADEDLALQGADDGAQVDEIVTDDANQEDDQQQRDDPAIEALARDIGWTPREEFRGDPEKWKPASQFIRDGRDIQQTTSRELRSMKEQIERFGRISEELLTDRKQQQIGTLEAQFEKAVEDGDTEAARRLRDEMAKVSTVSQQTGDAPEVAAWRQKNTWFDTDPVAQMRAKEVARNLAAQGLGPAEQLAGAERVIRKEYPELFPTPAKQQPGTTTSRNGTTTPTNRAKGFADMPRESQAMALKMIERNPSLTKEAIAQSYFADVAKQQRRA